MTVHSRWLMRRHDTGRLWVTAGSYAVDDLFQRFRSSMPVCPLADIQAGDYDAVCEISRGLVALKVAGA